MRQGPYEYVGPRELLAAASSAPSGAPIHTRQDLMRWLRWDHGAPDPGWATYVVDLAGALLLAPRRSEHVACAGGQPVLGAGEIRFSSDGAVLEVSNNSTGYCPAEDSWAAVHDALSAAQVPHPDEFTFVARFRRCLQCKERNLVKDEWYHCDFCGAQLSATWNFTESDSS